jgi:hypothetical protein
MTSTTDPTPLMAPVLPPRRVQPKPTAAEINALPEHIRSYIHELEAGGSQAELVQDNVALRDQLAQLEVLVQQWRRQQARLDRGGSSSGPSC